jgi:PBP1b-binding outer membrane lipoprotein LpoB
MSKKISLLLIIVLLSFFLTGCSGDKEKKEKGTIKQGTDAAAKQATDMIKIPLDQAKGAALQQENRGREIEEQQK